MTMLDDAGSFNSLVPSCRLALSTDKVLEKAQATGVIDLSSRNIKDFPQSRDKFQLQDTVIADLSRNKLVDLPEECTEFFYLERLLLYHNSIRSIPDSVVRLQFLQFLDISRNQLSYLPDTICQLPSLKVLVANNNRLVSLPEEIGRMQSLTQLDASCNEITHLPVQIGDMVSLRSLNLRSNHLQEIPIEISFLRLVHLDLGGNRISLLPVELRFMTSIVNLNLGENPLTCPPANLCCRGKVHIFKHLEIQAIKEDRKRGVLTESESRMRPFRKTVTGGQLSDFRFSNGFGADPGRKRYTADSGYGSEQPLERRWSEDFCPQDTVDAHHTEDARRIVLRACNYPMSNPRTSFAAGPPTGNVITNIVGSRVSASVSTTNAATSPPILPPQQSPLNSASSSSSTDSSSGHSSMNLGTTSGSSVSHSQMNPAYSPPPPPPPPPDLRKEEPQPLVYKHPAFSSPPVPPSSRSQPSRSKSLLQKASSNYSRGRTHSPPSHQDLTTLYVCQNGRLGTDCGKDSSKSLASIETTSPSVYTNIKETDAVHSETSIPVCGKEATKVIQSESENLDYEDKNIRKYGDAKVSGSSGLGSKSTADIPSSITNTSSDTPVAQTAFTPKCQLPTLSPRHNQPLFPHSQNPANTTLKPLPSPSSMLPVPVSLAQPLKSPGHSQNQTYRHFKEQLRRQNVGQRSGGGIVTTSSTLTPDHLTNSHVTVPNTNTYNQTTTESSTRLQTETLTSSKTVPSPSSQNGYSVLSTRASGGTCPPNYSSSGYSSSNSSILQKYQTAPQSSSSTSATASTSSLVTGESSSQNFTPNVKKSAFDVKAAQKEAVLFYVKSKQSIPARNSGSLLSANGNGGRTLLPQPSVPSSALTGQRTISSNRPQTSAAIATQKRVVTSVDALSSGSTFTMKREADRTSTSDAQISQLKTHIEGRLRIALPEDMSTSLTDGVILCHLANHVRPRAVPSIHVPSPAVPKLNMAKCRRNVENFLLACRRVGVREDLICSPADVLEPRRQGTVRVAITVSELLKFYQPKTTPNHHQQHSTSLGSGQLSAAPASVRL